MSLYWCVARGWLRFRASVFKLWFLFHKKRREKEVGREKQEQRKGLRNWRKRRKTKVEKKPGQLLGKHSLCLATVLNKGRIIISNIGLLKIEDDQSYSRCCVWYYCYFSFLNRKAPDFSHREELATECV